MQAMDRGKSMHVRDHGDAQRLDHAISTFVSLYLNYAPCIRDWGSRGVKWEVGVGGGERGKAMNSASQAAQKGFKGVWLLFEKMLICRKVAMLCKGSSLPRVRSSSSKLSLREDYLP